MARRRRRGSYKLTLPRAEALDRTAHRIIAAPIAAAWGVQLLTVTGERRSWKNAHTLTRLWRNLCVWPGQLVVNFPAPVFWSTTIWDKGGNMVYTNGERSEGVSQGRYTVPSEDKREQTLTYHLAFERPPYPSFRAFYLLTQEPLIAPLFSGFDLDALSELGYDFSAHERMEAMQEYRPRLAAIREWLGEEGCAIPETLKPYYEILQDSARDGK